MVATGIWGDKNADNTRILQERDTIIYDGKLDSWVEKTRHTLVREEVISPNPGKPSNTYMLQQLRHALLRYLYG